MKIRRFFFRKALAKSRTRTRTKSREVVISNKFLLRIATSLEEFLYKKSILVTGQTQGIVKNISSRFPDKKVYWLPNGVDLSYYNPADYNKKWRNTETTTNK